MALEDHLSPIPVPQALILSPFTILLTDWNEKVGSQETPGVTGRFDLGV